MAGLRISELASCSGVPATTLRYYEQVGLLPAGRAPSGYRIYDDRAVERLRFIGAAKELKLSLDSIRTLLRAWEDEPCRTVKAQLRSMVAVRLQETGDDVAALTALAGSLRAELRRLDGLPDRDQACDPSCAFLDDRGNGTDLGVVGTAVDESESAANEGKPPPVACSLSAAGQRGRLAQWHALLAVARIHQTAKGVVADLPISAVTELTALIVAEQECCPFFGFEVAFRRQRLLVSITAESPVPVMDLLPTRTRG